MVDVQHLGTALLVCAAAAAAQPLSLHPANPRYFSYRGTPTVLVASGEHYGSVMNLDFDYVRYLDTLARDRLNVTRVFTGVFRGSFPPNGSPLVVKPDRFITPWPRIGRNGASDGLGKFDLTKWNEAYYRRLQDFVAQAEKRGVIVELVLFCTYYNDADWSLSPLNVRNNINGIGRMGRKDVLTLKDRRMLQVHEAMVRRIVSELRDRDNLYYEICNEPYIHGVSPEWQAHIAKVIVETERGWPQRRHLIAQNIGNRSSRVQNPDSNVSVLNFHYSRPPDSVRLNRDLNRAVGNNETGFDGVSDAVYRIQGWEFLLAGGALYNSLDYSFAAGKEDGTFRYPPSHWGGGSPELRRQLGFLRRFMDSLDLVNLAPAREIIKGGPGNGVSAYVLTKRGAQYAVYLHRGSPVAKSDVPPGAARYTVSQAAERDTIVLELPPGSYSGEWMDTKSGKSTPLRFRHAQGNRKLESPVYKEDIALRLTRAAGRTR